MLTVVDLEHDRGQPADQQLVLHLLRPHVHRVSQVEGEMDGEEIKGQGSLLFERKQHRDEATHAGQW